MPSFTATRRVRHSATDMFDLVADVEAYPKFLPMCERLTVRSRRKDGDRDVLIATMTVAYKFVRESFTTRVTLDRASFLIQAEYIDGPFSHLENVWRFEPHGRGDCIIRFSIDYEFKSRLLQMLIGSLFERVFARYTEAFEARADAVYGVEGGTPRLSPA
ncbi:MAG: type II toxin-antitoxin system RatA family toxin [Rhizobiales bacterium]|nr:type II toxin-antitoxin system RatA family toxin [Hyphomicrobiales bacterium]